MNQKQRVSNERLAQLKEILDGAFGESGYPPQLVGDLDNCAWRMARASYMIHQLRRTGPRVPEEVNVALYRIFLDLRDDIGLILEDLLPDLEELLAVEEDE